MPKIISKHCELVKLCHIIVAVWFFETQCKSVIGIDIDIFVETTVMSF